MAKKELIIQRQFRDRCSIELSRQDVREMIDQIRTKRAPLVKEKSAQVGFYRINYNESTYIVGYNRFRKVLLTVVPSPAEI